jgi:WD40 repeat protein
LSSAGRERTGDGLRSSNRRPQTSAGDPTERVLPVEASSLLMRVRSHQGRSHLYTIDVHPVDRKRFITSGSDGCVRLFDLRMLRGGVPQDVGFCVSPRYGHAPSVTGAAFDANGERIAATVLGGQIHVFRTEGLIELNRLPPAPQRPRVQIGELDFRLRHFQVFAEDAPTPAPPAPIPGEIRELTGHRSETTVKAVNWHGDFVVSGSDEGCLFWFDPENGEIANAVRAHRRNVNVVSVHKEKKLLATGGADDFALLWEPTKIAQRDLAIESVRVDKLMDELEEMDRHEVSCSVM